MGTHKDKARAFVQKCYEIYINMYICQVPLLRDHFAINTLLLREFGEHPLWPTVLRCDYSCCSGHSQSRECFFFPVNNNAFPGRDPVVDHLRFVLARHVSQEPYVRWKVPFAWLAALDKLYSFPTADRGQRCMSLSLRKVVELSGECGVRNTSVDCMLHLFSELGLVMHHPEPALRHVVILDPATFLVEPASRLVFLQGYHHLPHQKNCSQRLPRDYKKLIIKGRVSKRLLSILWEERQSQDRQDLELLLVRYGLIVPLVKVAVDKALKEQHETNEYLVPAVLPRLEFGVLMDVVPVARAVFLFGEEDVLLEWRGRGCVTVSEARNAGFLPSGVFAQVETYRKQPTDLRAVLYSSCSFSSIRNYCV